MTPVRDRDVYPPWVGVRVRVRFGVGVGVRVRFRVRVRVRVRLGLGLRFLEVGYPIFILSYVTKGGSERQKDRLLSILQRYVSRHSSTVRVPLIYTPSSLSLLDQG